MPNQEEYLMPGQIARKYGVSTKTVTRWAKAGKLPHIRTIGGHRRYSAKAVEQLMTGKTGE